MRTGISNPPDGRYWRQLYRAALSEIDKSKLPEAHCRSGEGSCAPRAGIVSGSRR